jgi:AraC-like DNA-binding protein
MEKLLVLRPEERSVRSNVTRQLSALEGEVIAKIRIWRLSLDDEFHQELLQHPARVMQHFILLYHGHVKFHFRPIAQELGVEIRTLERAFVEEFGKTMFQCQARIRSDTASLDASAKDQRGRQHAWLRRAARLPSLL